MTGIDRRQAVLVCGPPRAGAGGVAVALRHRRPALEVVEPGALTVGQAPVAVVFVVSAAAQLTGSDCALLDIAAAHTDAVVAAVTKTDAHRDWRDTLAADRATLRAYRARYGQTPWVGVAASPPVGPPRIDGLLEVLDTVLSDPKRDSRNTLRSNESHIESEIRRYRGAAEVSRRGDRLTQLRAERAELADRARREYAQRGAQMRSRIRETGVELSYLVAARTAAVRAELQEAAAVLNRAAVPGFATRVGQRVEALTTEIAEACERRLADIAADLGLDEPRPAPGSVDVPASTAPVPAAALENRLTTMLGVGFGLGFAVTLRRLFDAVSPGSSPFGILACAVFGVVLAGWIVGVRRLLAQRAAHDRRVGEVLGRLRPALDRHIAVRLSTAERTWADAEADRAGGVAARTAGRLAAIDTEVAELTRSHNRAAADRDRALPELHRALADVRRALQCACPEELDSDLNRCTSPGRAI